MRRTNLSLLTIALATFGISIIAGHPDWGTFLGLIILLIAAGLAVGTLPSRSEQNIVIVEERAASQKVSSTLVTLSSAAILAVYAAGYYRTDSAAEGYLTQTARRRTADLIVPGVMTPPVATPGVKATPAVRPSPAPPVRKASPKTSSNQTSNTAPSPATSEDSAATAFAPPAIRPSDDQPAEPAAPVVRTPAGKYKDGTYSGLGSSRHGDIQASVVIQDGQIVSAEIARCLTRYPCSWIVHLPKQVVSKQSTKVNYVSGATESCDAFFDAVNQALSQASE
jgi:uncharacterized protein with FMN-binding domain